MKTSKILLTAMVLSTVATGVLAEEVKTWDIVPTNRNTNENYHVTLNYLNSRPESYANVDTNLDFIRIHDKNDQITEISGGSRSRVAIGKEVLALKKTVAEQNAQIQKLTALLNGVAGTKMKADHTTLFPEMALFRVDTIAKNGQGEPTIERVRVNKK